MNIKNIFSVFAFALLAVFALSFASASDLVLTSTSSSSINATHGTTTSVNLPFTLSNNNTDLSFSLVWSNSTTSDKLILVAPSLSSILPSETQSRSATLNIAIPQYTYPNSYYASLSVQGTNDTDTISSNILQYTIVVPSSPSFTLTKVDDISSRTGDGSFTITNTGNVPLSLTFSSSGAFGTQFYDGINLVTSVSVSVQGTKTIKVVPINIPTSLNFGDNTVTVTANDSTNKVSNQVSFSIYEGFCKPSVGTNLSIDDIDISNEGTGDDNEWFLLDSVTIKADITNEGDTDLDDVYAVLGIFDSTGKNVANKMIYSSSDEEKVDLGDIDSGDDKRATFEFKLPGDLSTGSYKIVVKAYSKDAGESNLCADSSIESVSIKNQDDSGKYIGFDDIKLSSDSATCGDTMTLDLNVVNVGEDDEDQVKILLFNRDLGINQYVEIKQGLDQGDSQAISFTFDVPNGVQDKTYSLELTSEYDYSNGVYEEESDYTEIVPLRVFGCTPSSSNLASISASLQSDAVAGEDLSVGVTIQNTGTSSATYSVDVRGYSEWATLNSISDRLVTLGAGESKTIQVSLLPNQDVSGDESFTIQLSSGSQVQTKQVVVSFEEASSSSFLDSIKGNSLAWIIGLVNVVLIILIIIVAVKLSRN